MKKKSFPLTPHFCKLLTVIMRCPGRVLWTIVERYWYRSAIRKQNGPRTVVAADWWPCPGGTPRVHVGTNRREDMPWCNMLIGTSGPRAEFQVCGFVYVLSKRGRPCFISGRWNELGNLSSYFMEEYVWSFRIIIIIIIYSDLYIGRICVLYGGCICREREIFSSVRQEVWVTRL